MPDTRVEQTAHLSASQVDDVLSLVERIAAVDGVRPVSEQATLNLMYGTELGIRHVLVWSGRELSGYAQLDLNDAAAGATAEIAGLGAEHLQALVEALSSEPGDRLRVWARGQRSGAIAVLSGMGFHTTRVLLQLRRSLADPLPEPAWPDGVTVRTFVVGQDEGAWLAVNNVAFAGHPEQSDWTVEDIEQREREPWFDPTGFFLAELDNAVVGFHWTKVHDLEIGEVYVVGVAPSMRGRQLGSALTAVGLQHLRGLGLSTVMLYVDDSNTSAVHVYERLGFTRWDADTCLQR